MTRRKNIVISLVCILLAIALVAGYFLYSRNNLLSSNTSAVTITNQEELNNQGLSIKTLKPETLSNLFTQTKLIDGNQVTNVEIVFSKEPNPNATFFRADIPNQIFVSSNYEKIGSSVVITMYASPELKTKLPTQQASELNYYFWKVADLVASTNLNGAPNPKDNQEIFLPL